MKEAELKVLATGTAVAAKRAAEKAVQELRAEASVDLEGLKGALAARHDAIERALTDEVNKSRDDVVARFNDSEHRVDVKMQALTESQQIHADFIENLRQKSDEHGKRIEEARSDVVAKFHTIAEAYRAVQETVDGVDATVLAAEERIKSDCASDIEAAEHTLAGRLSAEVATTKEMLESWLDERRTGLLEEVAKQVADLGVLLGTAQSEFEAAVRAFFQEADQKLQDRVERDTNDLVLTIEARLEGAEEKRDALDETSRKVTEEFGILAESAAKALLDMSEAKTALQEEVTGWVRNRVGEARASLETTAALLLEETRDARDQIVDDVFDTAKEYVESLKIPDPIPGEKGDCGPAGEKGAPGRDGAVASVSYWKRDEYYSKDTAVSHFSGLWVATCNTDTEPGKGDAWVNVAGGVEAPALDENGVLSLRMSDGRVMEVGDIRGPEGRSWQHQGTYNPDGWYTRSDVVVLRGTSYVAVDDSPGECPGPGWRMVAQAQKGPAGKPGKQGKAGDPGRPGPVGAPGISISWRGAFEMGQTYNTNDACSYNSGVWIALQQTSVPPKADGENWDPMIRGQSSRGGGGNVASASGSMTIVTLTQAEYDALSPPLDNHLYLVCG